MPIGYCKSSVLSLLKSTPSWDEKQGLFSSTVMSTRPMQLLNTPIPILSTLLGIFMFSSLSQFTNAKLSMLSTPSGMFIFLRRSQVSKDELPIVLTPKGRVMLYRLSQL